MILYLDQNLAGRPLRSALQELDASVEIRSIAQEGWSTKPDGELAELAAAAGAKAVITMDSRIKKNPHALAQFAANTVLVCFDYEYNKDPPGIVAAICNAWPAVLKTLRTVVPGNILTVTLKKGIVHTHNGRAAPGSRLAMLTSVCEFHIPSLPKQK